MYFEFRIKFKLTANPAISIPNFLSGAYITFHFVITPLITFGASTNALPDKP